MSQRNGAIIAFFSTLIGCAVLWADTPPENADDLATKSRVLLFRSGRVVEGRIAETQTHYVVIRPIGTVEVAKTNIELVASDLEEIYRYKLARVNERDPEEHLRLAQWCQFVNLREHA